MAQRKPRRLELEALLEYALRALGVRAHSISELREKLHRRAEREDDVGEVLGRLKQRGYLDDRRFAQSYASWRLEREGFGRSRVLRELRQKRVAPAVADEVVKAVYSGADEVVLIEAFLERKYRKTPLKAYLADPRHLASAYRRLRLAGFTSTNAIRVLKRYADEAESLESLETQDGEGRDS
jgi:regulatory protein